MSNEETAVTTTETKAVAAPGGSNYITAMLEEVKRGFVEANAGLDLDFVRMGTFLRINKKGNIVEAKDENVSFGDTLDVVVAMGEQRWSLWGEEGSPEDGTMIVAEKTEQEAKEALSQWLSENPEAAERYDVDDVKLRYIAYVVPVESIKAAAENDDIPDVYLMPFATVDSYDWGAYAMNVYKGKYKAMGIPSKTPVNSVITRLETVEKDRKGTTDKFTGLKYQPVALFNPAEFGVVNE